MGANNADFVGSGNAARSTELDGTGSGTDIHGAPTATSHLDGPPAIAVSGSQNKFTGSTASAPAYSGT